MCALQIRTERAEELKLAVGNWGPAAVAMLSLTVRHGMGDDLRGSRSGLSRSFQRLINGQPWKRFCSKHGVEHHVRSLEVTHGANGWHPHLHVLFFLEVPLTEEQLQSAETWLQSRWAQCVRRELGADFVPNEHGVDLREAKRADYLAKLSFELVDPGTKRGRGRNRTPLEIAASAASGRSPSDVALWVEYCAGMRRAKMLTWSRGLRALVELDAERSDADVANAEELHEGETVAVMQGSAWDRVRDRPGAPCAILEAAELAAARPSIFQAIEAVVHGRDQLACLRPAVPP